MSFFLTFHLFSAPRHKILYLKSASTVRMMLYKLAWSLFEWVWGLCWRRPSTNIWRECWIFKSNQKGTERILPFFGEITRGIWKCITIWQKWIDRASRLLPSATVYCLFHMKIHFFFLIIYILYRHFFCLSWECRKPMFEITFRTNTIMTPTRRLHEKLSAHPGLLFGNPNNSR